MRRDEFTRDRDDMAIGERVAVIAGGFFTIAFMVAAVARSLWGDDNL